MFRISLVKWGQTGPGQGEEGEPKKQVICTDINDTLQCAKTCFNPEDGSYYFSFARIDLADKDGYVCQAMVCVCRGSESYAESFRKYLSGLEAAYSGQKAPIAGHLDLWWGNRIRNWINYDYYGMKQVSITDPDGFTHGATVVAVCGSDEFMEQYVAIRHQYLEKYENALIHKRMSK